MDLFWIVILTSVLGVYASPACDEETVRKCDFHGYPPDDGFPMDVFQLKKQCSEEFPKFACVADFMERCPSIFTKEARDFYMAGEIFAKRICDGDLRDQYLRNAKCIGGVYTSKQDYCTDKDKMSDSICVSQAAFGKCVGSFIESTCGREAYEISYELYKVIRLINGCY